MDEEIKKIVEKNLKLTEETYVMVKKIKNHLNFQRLVGVFYLIIIIVPIIWGMFFLPPLLKNLIEQYESVLDIDPNMINTLFKK